jgi:hypothetical protein
MKNNARPSPPAPTVSRSISDEGRLRPEKKGYRKAFPCLKKPEHQTKTAFSLTLQVIGRHILHELFTTRLFTLQNILVIGGYVLIEVFTTRILAQPRVFVIRRNYPHEVLATRIFTLHLATSP